MKWIVASAILVSAPASTEMASTGPTYLACQIQQDTGPLSVDVSVDEANQRVTIALPSGRTVTRQAVFGPDLIRVPDEQQEWFFNRVDLTFGRTFAFAPNDPGEHGTCKLQPAPAKRAF